MRTRLLRLPDDRDGKVEWTYADLERRARVIAARLQLSQPGDRAILVPAGIDFIAAFSAAVCRRGRCSHHLSEATASDARPNRWIATPMALSTAAALTTLDPEFSKMLPPANGSPPTGTGRPGRQWQRPIFAASDLAFLQYTTARPATRKGCLSRQLAQQPGMHPRFRHR